MKFLHDKLENPSVSLNIRLFLAKLVVNTEEVSYLFLKELFSIICISLEKEMAAHSSIPAWEIPWTEEPGGLQSMGTQRVIRDLATKHKRTCESTFKKPTIKEDVKGHSMALFSE